MTEVLHRLIHRVPFAGLLLQREPRSLILVGLIFGGLWVFGLIANQVTRQGTQDFDTRFMLLFRDTQAPFDPLGPAWMQTVAMDATAMGGYTVLTIVTLMAMGYLFLRRQVGKALLVGFAVNGGTVVSQTLKSLFDRPRPDLVAHMVEVQTLSFPSGHSTLSAVAYLTLGALLAQAHSSLRLKTYFIAWAVFLAIAVGLSRVYLGVHWPTDVLAGWSLGTAWALLCWLVAASLSKRRQAGRDA